MEDGENSSGSIIRSIMIEQEEHDRLLDPLMVAISAVNSLKDREKEVVLGRYGLLDGQKRTLDDMGKKFGVTRERVRQIEVAAVKKIAGKPGRDLLQTIKVITNHIIECGGVVSLDELVKYFHIANDPRLEAQQNALRLILAINKGVVPVGKSDSLKQGWAIVGFNQALLPMLATTAAEVLQKAGHPLSVEELWEEMMHSEVYEKHGDKLTTSVLVGAMRVSDKLAETDNEMWGLVSWPTVVPKRIRDKVYAVLEKGGRPLHFRDIADEINKQYAGKPVLARTVHNELIGDKRFVLVGRGIYALQEMGYDHGVVADVIVDILKGSETPLTTDEIVDRVLLSRKVKRNTVVANLQNKDLFRKVDKNMYELAR